MRLWKDIIFRTIATIVLKVSVTGGGLSLLGAGTSLALVGAAFVGIMEVAEEMAKAYLKDGQITQEELNAMGNKIVTNTKTKK
jgi:uncharacterized membrane protein